MNHVPVMVTTRIGAGEDEPDMAVVPTISLGNAGRAVGTMNLEDLAVS